jgi:SNF2 family DNA or RNA helicase
MMMMMTTTTMVRPQVDEGQADSVGDEDEGEDVIIRPTVQSSQAQLEYTETGPSESKLGRPQADELVDPDCRPAFPITVNQAMIGPLQLDPEDPSIAVPASINRFLRPYQQEGVKFFYKQYMQGKGGILGDDMGFVLDLDIDSG